MEDLMEDLMADQLGH
jgi:hypothetical protein